jgi:hypothetical protein
LRTDTAADAAPPRTVTPGEHRHQWSGVEFFLEEDRPRFRMRCACGAERVIRAWERYWDPASNTEADHRGG